MVDSSRAYIVHDIIRGLYEGRYVPGQRLAEVNLTSHYQTSRGPVREALNWLSANGIVSLIPQKGAQIRKLSRTEAIDMLVVVEQLVGLAARLAAKRIKERGAAATLRRALAELRRFEVSSAQHDYATARDRFYGALLDIAGNSELWLIMPRVLVHLLRAQFREELSLADGRRHVDYRSIAEHVLAGREAAAERTARAHIAASASVLRDSAQRHDGLRQGKPAARSNSAV
jgi:DNA-binding GntR family transcriptional regulator